jgi:energy-converting hydrogenase A subunit D
LRGAIKVNEYLPFVLGALVVIGALATIREKNPYNKLVSLSLMIGGAIPFIVDRGLLDVAIAVALIAPISTIFILMAMRRGPA